MSRVPAIALSFALILLWVAGLCRQASGWLTWLDFVAGLIAFGSAAQLATSRRAGIVGWGLLAFSLFVLSISALVTGGRSWLASWTLVCACAFLMLAWFRSRRDELRTNGST